VSNGNGAGGGSGLRAILAALGANIGIALSKFVAFLFTGSSSMLAESVHSMADSTNQILLLIGGRRSRQPASEAHPFGYGRYRYLYAFLVAMVIFGVGGVFALYEGYHKFHDPEPLEAPAWAIGVLAVAIVLEAFSLRTAVRESREARGGDSVRTYIRRSKAPEIPVVMLEDFGALTGLGFAAIGVVLTVLTDDGRWDALGTLAIGVLLIAISIVLARRTRSLLIGESAEPDVVDRIRQALTDSPHVIDVIHIRTVHLSPEQLLVAAKIAVRADATAAEVARTIDEAEVRVREAIEYDCLIYLEPDLLRAG
jgi:cation diffusion facilitator family transporter